MISVEITDKPDSNWNKRLIDSKLGTIYQTQEYGLYTNSALGWQTDYLKFVNQKGEIVGQLMLSVYSRFTKKGNVGKILKKIPGQKKTICRWIYGPVVSDLNHNDEICKLIHDFLISKNYLVLGSEHPLSGGILNALGKPFRIKNWGTFLIDLSLGQDVLWKNLDKHSARKNIERSKKRGVYIKEMQRSDLISYHKMLQETKQKVDSNVNISDVEILWDNLYLIGLTGFLAFEDEIPIGGILVSSFNKYINEWGVARTEKDVINKLYSHDLLKWEIIEWGIKNKFHFYDLSGVSTESKNEKEMGIFRYKKKWGGTYVEYQTCHI